MTRVIAVTALLIGMAGHLFSDEAVFIIDDTPLFLQEITLQAIIDLPEIENAWPVDGRIAAGRIWLPWPEALISLNLNGEADVYTLLHFRTSRRIGDGYHPAPGGITPDGKWAVLAPEGNAIVLTDPVTGATETAVGDLPTASKIEPLGAERYLLSGEREAWIVVIEDSGIAFRDIAENLPPGGGSALHYTGKRAAWIDASGGYISLGTLDSAETISFPPPAGMPLAIAWIGDYLVCGYGDGSGNGLIVVDPDNSGDLLMEIPTEDLPYWYALRGGKKRLMILDPTGGRILLVGVDTGFPASAGDSGVDLGEASEKDLLDRLVEKYLVDAAEILEEHGVPAEAEALYGWALPRIRRLRSRYPLDTRLPELEKRATDERARLRRSQYD